ncbi:hypothetical protein TEA_018957 [Camellia sinensis var. sinensis]|uniref:Uncharacterized protein n=1 Tax=Camellia sinensis var. sinensis TaxID=542762 RepID=A0A4S4EEY2_CAMSN|nr:hypothetical protein TEA_018957 [Camellia sinensis var. sinensis]
MPIVNLVGPFDSSTRVVQLSRGLRIAPFFRRTLKQDLQLLVLKALMGLLSNRIISLTESTIASGDDEGCIKVWDTRQRTCCNSFDVHEEYISDMTLASDSIRLLGTSGDGTLSVCNLRSNKVQTRSEFSEDELLSVLIMKNGRKVICGTQTGTLLLYSWGFFKDCSDRFVDLSPNSIDALLKLDEDRVITGSENGLISLVGILPNRIIQPIAEHSEYPIERLAFSHDKKFLGSTPHDPLSFLFFIFHFQTLYFFILFDHPHV